MAEKKRSTSPWKQKRWSPDIFRIKPRKGYRVRFVSKENIEEHKYEGYSIADGKNYGLDTGQVIRKGMVMMETSERNALEREEYFADLTDRRSQTAASILKATAAEGEGGGIGVTEVEEESTSVKKLEP